LVTTSLSVVSEARVSKLDTRARCVCALKAILKEKRKNEKEKPLNRMCANSKLSQQKGSPH